MKNIFHKILSRFNINGRDLTIFILSLLLAFSIWLIHNLSLKYTAYMQMPVVAQCNIEGHAAKSSNKNDVVARCRTTGYNILKNNLKFKTSAVSVPFSRMYQDGEEIFYVTEKELIEYFPAIFGDGVSLDHYLTDTLYFRFPLETYKKVEVRALSELDFKSQYTAVSEMRVEPDSVTVYGDPARLENMEYVYTVPVKLSNIDGSARGMVKLDKIRGIRFSEDAVKYSLDVARYVEVSSTVNVQTRNVPPSKAMLVLPSMVRLTMRCRFPYSNNVQHDLSVYVDYEDFVSSMSGNCLLRADGLTDEILSYTTEPQLVECIVYDR